MLRTNARRRGLAAGALAVTAAVSLAACGSDSDSGSGSGSGEKDSTTHTIKTAMGDVKVPTDPQRVVVLDTPELDSAITLGVKPVGAVRADVESKFLNYLPKDEVEGIKDVGTIGNPNLETIAGLKPDLILSSKFRDGQRYDQLKEIAPTVFAEEVGAPWKENFELHAEALGKKDEAKTVVADYDKHVKSVNKALGGPAKAKDTTVNVLRFMEGMDTRIYADKNYIGTILQDVGVSRPEEIIKQADKGERPGFTVEVSPEQIDKADADVIFYTSYGSTAKSGEDKALKSPLWKNMKAVKDGKAFHVNDELWMQGIGYTAANKILDEMQKDLTKK
ncbi:iron-siderophore ABC transporter substrate-binding protein [Streptomyces sp. A7024]|uniref:Iron-siderophore ABC transporter substrate-binding protein n=1 Tax=Streptomyces coryli TaxID=1128680 RepID=A0A6G4TYE4_9ACTN|nr:iron-siderophore ABC transporter substrate-binding protein [Streptomyces coryli]NGN64843.1 iron-siderophore ABC transporter substrate-binding protein [Streptomyces coryli]